MTQEGWGSWYSFKMKTKKTESGYFLCLSKGEKLIDSILEHVKKDEIPSGTFSAVGAVKNIRLGFYHLHSKSYEEKVLPGDHELLNLSGNIAWKDSAPIVHCHIVVGDTNFQVLGGHLFEAEVAVTVEVFLSVQSSKIYRRLFPEVGLNLQDLEL